MKKYQKLGKIHHCQKYNGAKTAVTPVTLRLVSDTQHPFHHLHGMGDILLEKPMVTQEIRATTSQ